MPNAQGANWEKFRRNAGEDGEPEKKIAPLTDEYVLSLIPNPAF